MKPRRGLVQNIQSLARGFFGEFRREFHSLGLPSGERGRGLPQFHVGKPHFVQGLNSLFYLGNVLEKIQRFFNGQIQNLRNIEPVVLNRQGLFVVSGSVALLAFHVNIRQEIHLNFFDPLPLAKLAPPAFDVERKTPRLIAAASRLSGFGEKLPDKRESPGISGGIGTWRSAYRRLVHHHDFI